VFSVRIAALIVAAGRGTRANSGAPKQYLPLGGAPVITRTVGAFASHSRIDDILVVIHPDDAELYAVAMGSFAGRLLPPAAGGASRQESVFAGLEALAETVPDLDLVLIHDAARPFVEEALIDRVIDGLAAHAGALPCLPVTDTLKRARDGRVTATVDRTELWRAQTPQGFKFAAILAAHRAAAEQGEDNVSDDAGIAERFGLDVGVVEGAEANEKLTSAEDLAMADERLRAQGAGPSAQTIVGTGYDVHACAPGDAVILCGVSIPHHQKLVGHSDADVGLHALTDALLGAIAEGDIGVHFPPSDERWRGAASELFLKDAALKVTARGGEIVHVDVTLLCESPRIGPYREAMRTRIAEMLGLDLDQVSVKATTNEGLGFIGRGEGIAAMATATVRLP
jgi:2-C-methyl-D-erythritol 4-phosphate cytidylyltransferase/2-C-methyl-D-erythritol 2,4-cyclodiphosphate synthase